MPGARRLRQQFRVSGVMRICYSRAVAIFDLPGQIQVMLLQKIKSKGPIRETIVANVPARQTSSKMEVP